MPSVRARGGAGRSRLVVRERRAGVVGARPGDGDRPDSGGIAQGEIAEIQRSRLLTAAVAAIDELGYPNTSVAGITSRARVSRRTFYELFTNREECLVTMLEEVVHVVEEELERAGLEGLAWRERVRGGLWAILSFFDREPALARVCVIGALGGGPVLLERRERVLEGLARVVHEGHLEGARGSGCSILTAEGLVGAACAIVHARLLRGGRAGEDVRLCDLLGELMAMIVLPYLGPTVARRELTRTAPAGVAAEVDPAEQSGVAADRDALADVSMRLTYRTAKVLEVVAQVPGANNRQVGIRAGVSDQGQVSKLLARLERLGLLANRSGGHVRGAPNEWWLTGKGERVTRSINAHARNRRTAA